MAKILVTSGDENKDDKIIVTEDLSRFFRYVKLVTGEDIVGTLYQNNPGYNMILGAPMRVVQIQEDDGTFSVAFIKWMPFTTDEMIAVNWHSILAVSTVDKELTEYYNGALNALKEEAKKNLSLDEKARKDFEDIIGEIQEEIAEEDRIKAESTGVDPKLPIVVKKSKRGKKATTKKSSGKLPSGEYIN